MFAITTKNKMTIGFLALYAITFIILVTILRIGMYLVFPSGALDHLADYVFATIFNVIVSIFGVIGVVGLVTKDLEFFGELSVYKMGKEIVVDGKEVNRQLLANFWHMVKQMLMYMGCFIVVWVIMTIVTTLMMMFIVWSIDLHTILRVMVFGVSLLFSGLIVCCTGIGRKDKR